jgi:hypothetical protein
LLVLDIVATGLFLRRSLVPKSAVLALELDDDRF